MEEKILNDIIIGYRKWIDERYRYESLSKKYDLPDSIDEAKVEQLRSFFLDNIYPDIEKRKELNEAFESLDEYVKNPRKLFTLISASARLLFRYGRDLPKILSAAIKTLRSFRAANLFEKELANIAREANEKPPYTIDQMKTFISALPESDVTNFINSTESLFQTFIKNQKLVGKIKALVTDLVKKMKERSDLFSPKEISGIELGLELITKGDEMLTSLSSVDKDYILDMVVKIEKGIMGEIFKKT